MNYTEFKQEIENIKSYGQIHSLKDKAQIQSIYDLWIKVYGYQYKIGCSSCFLDCFLLLLKIDETKFNQMKNCEFELKGAVYMTAFSNMSTWVNKHNLSNENALWHLCNNRTNISKFQMFPDDWEKRIENKICGEFPALVDIVPEVVTEEIVTENAEKYFEETHKKSAKKGKK